MKQKELLIIIPAYNEESNIDILLEQLEQPEIREAADILVLDDASTDRTGEIARRRGHQVITHVYNLGYGCGLWVGYKYAVKRGYRYIIQMDADGQHDVCNVMTIYQKLQIPNQDGCKPDIVLGSRFLKESVAYPISFVKKIAYTLFRILIRIGTGKWIKDPTTGLQGLSRRAFTFYAKFKHFDDKYPDANMIMQMLLLGFHVEEVPAVMHSRVSGVSMHSGILKPLNYMLRMMFSIIAVWIRVKIFRVDKGITDENVA